MHTKMVFVERILFTLIHSDVLFDYIFEVRNPQVGKGTWTETCNMQEIIRKKSGYVKYEHFPLHCEGIAMELILYNPGLLLLYYTFN